MDERKLISREQTWKGLRMELSVEELQAIFQQTFEEDTYFDFELLLDGLHKILRKEIDFDYYTSWCILIANCFTYTNYESKALNNLLGEIGYFFDGCSFEEEWNEKELYYNIASLKYFNHLYENKRNKKRSRFLTDGVERFLVFDHANRAQDSRVLRAIIKDNTKKEFDLRYVDEADFTYDENVNYSFVDEEAFEDVFNSFYRADGEWTENHKLKF